MTEPELLVTHDGPNPQAAWRAGKIFATAHGYITIRSADALRILGYRYLRVVGPKGPTTIKL
jgi:hypothetical protein